MLTDKQVRALAEASLRGSGRPLTEDEIARVIEWAQDTVLNAAMLELVLAGRLLVKVPEDGGDLLYLAPDEKTGPTASAGGPP